MTDASEHYGEAYYSGNGQDGDRPALKLFTRLARRYLRPGRIVDFGCGPGFFLMHLRHHFQASGVEQSDWASAAARGRTGVPIHASLAALEDASMDALVSVHVVEHIPDDGLTAVLAEWRRVLKPGARALVITPDAQGFAHRRKGAGWIAFTDPTHINLKSHPQWEAMFHAAGFTVVRRFADGLWDFPYVFRWLGKLEVLLLGWPTLLQFILARPLLPAGSGESIILVLERSQDRHR
ncbi:class I SAM-dependent methyltransferase [Stenotrophomonas rhizophila]|uniref:class I SAM-dependent methyltransferase n=1 Tax=Stenotrophomonas rhizophila TaxID=216778 RepID=UPI0015E83C17|nr:class I SAM-dependent methyltransferase [Stenotrophomonas rhizophila]